MKIQNYGNKGFTLIEMMVVVVIIAILTSIILVNFGNARAKSRDTKRVSDIAQIQLALEQYYDRCQQYPTQAITFTNTVTDLTTVNSTCPSGINLGTFMARMPVPPTGANQPYYDYMYKNLSGNIVDYILHAKLETSIDAVKDTPVISPAAFSVPSGAPTPSPTVISNCSNAAGSLDYCVGPK